MKKNLLYFLLILLLSSCGNSRITEKVITTYDNGQPAKVYYYDAEGRWVSEADYYDQGALMMEGPIANNVRQGEWTSYFPDGKVQSTGIYEGGLRTGAAKIYHENGQLFMDGFYANDFKCGEWVFYDEQGYEVDRRDYGPCD